MLVSKFFAFIFYTRDSGRIEKLDTCFLTVLFFIF